MVRIIRGTSWKDPGCGNEFLARYETTERESRSSLHQPSACSGHDPGLGVRKLLNTPVGCIRALRHGVARNLPFARAVRSPPAGAEGRVELAVEPHHIALRTAPAVRVQVFVRCGVALCGLFGAIVIVTLLYFATLAHQRFSRVEHVSPRATSKVLSRGAPTSASSNSAASLETQSAIGGWFVLRQPPAPGRQISTVSPIRIFRVVPNQ